MVAIPISETQIIVVENRRGFGYDKGLATGGVLVYTVDASVESGQLPIKVAGTASHPQAQVFPNLIDDYPLLTQGQRVTVGDYTITVSSAATDTYTVTITKTGLPRVDISTDTGFGDIEGGSHEEAIRMLAAEGVFTGTECGESQFCPDEPIHRRTMAVWLVRVLDGSDPDAVLESRFSDVPGVVWWEPHVERLAVLGVTRGCATAPPAFLSGADGDQGSDGVLLGARFRLGGGSGRLGSETSRAIRMLLISMFWQRLGSQPGVLPTRTGTALPVTRLARRWPPSWLERPAWFLCPVRKVKN